MDVTFRILKDLNVLVLNIDIFVPIFRLRFTFLVTQKFSIIKRGF